MQPRLAVGISGISLAKCKVANIVAANPAAGRFTTAQLPHASGVSEPTVVRFWRSLGYEGLPNLRLA